MNNIYGNDSCIEIISQAINKLKAEQGDSFSIENINLAELSRRKTRGRFFGLPFPPAI